ncbi:MAG: hypothetical protein WCC12_21575 [Anaerolineales bacterium]
MKKNISIPLITLSLLVALVSVAAVPMAGMATLVSVVYVAGKGPVFTFTVSGKFSKAQLKGTLHVQGGADYSLHCTQVDKTTVKCQAPRKVAGVNVVVYLGGFKFWTYVPAARSLGYCYGIYDWSEYPQEGGPQVDWVRYGTHCQSSPAEYGDTIQWNNPQFGSSDYEFLPESPSGPSCVPHSGDGYYFNELLCAPIFGL